MGARLTPAGKPRASAPLASIYTTWHWEILASRRRGGRGARERLANGTVPPTRRASKTDSSTEGARRAGAVSYRLAETTSLPSDRERPVPVHTTAAEEHHRRRDDDATSRRTGSGNTSATEVVRRTDGGTGATDKR